MLPHGAIRADVLGLFSGASSVDTTGDGKFFGGSIDAVHPEALRSVVCCTNAEIPHALSRLRNHVGMPSESSKQDGSIRSAHPVTDIVPVQYRSKIGRGLALGPKLKHSECNWLRCHDSS